MSRRGGTRLPWLVLCLVLLCGQWANAQLEELFGGLLGALAGAGGSDGNGQCEYRCPSGKKPKPRKGHVPQSNGCGSYGMQVTAEGVDFEPCCDEHDFCYDTCGKTKAYCDAEFSACMKKMCDTIPDAEKSRQCHGSAGMFYLGTSAFGCDAYLKSQKGACKCPKKKLQIEQQQKAEL